MRESGQRGPARLASSRFQVPARFDVDVVHFHVAPKVCSEISDDLGVTRTIDAQVMVDVVQGRAKPHRHGEKGHGHRVRPARDGECDA